MTIDTFEISDNLSETLCIYYLFPETFLNLFIPIFWKPILTHNYSDRFLIVLSYLAFPSDYPSPSRTISYPRLLSRQWNCKPEKSRTQPLAQCWIWSEQPIMVEQRTNEWLKSEILFLFCPQNSVLNACLLTVCISESLPRQFVS